jgi:hypothetical protein
MGRRFHSYHIPTAGRRDEQNDGDDQIGRRTKTDHGKQTGHFYFAKDRTFLLCVDNRAIIGLTVYPDFATFVIYGEMWGLSQPYVPA